MARPLIWKGGSREWARASGSRPVAEADAEGRHELPSEAEQEQVAREGSQRRTGTGDPVGDAPDGPYGALNGSYARHGRGPRAHPGLQLNQLSQIHRGSGGQGLIQHVVPAAALRPSKAIADVGVSEDELDELFALPKGCPAGGRLHVGASVEHIVNKRPSHRPGPQAKVTLPKFRPQSASLFVARPGMEQFAPPMLYALEVSEDGRPVRLL